MIVKYWSVTYTFDSGSHSTPWQYPTQFSGLFLNICKINVRSIYLHRIICLLYCCCFILSFSLMPRFEIINQVHIICFMHKPIANFERICMQLVCLFLRATSSGVSTFVLTTNIETPAWIRIETFKLCPLLLAIWSVVSPSLCLLLILRHLHWSNL